MKSKENNQIEITRRRERTNNNNNNYLNNNTVKVGVLLHHVTRAYKYCQGSKVIVKRGAVGSDQGMKSGRWRGSQIEKSQKDD